MLTFDTQAELERFLAAKAAAAERAARQAERELGRELRHAEYRQVALAGGGPHERARRLAQRRRDSAIIYGW